MIEPGDATPPPDWRAVTLLVPVLAYQAMRKIGTIYDSDTWWHLASGRLILEQKAIPRVDSFSWTAAGEAWQPNGWLSDAFLAVLERLGGLPWVALLRPTFMVLIGIVVFVLGRRSGAGPWSALAAASFAVFFAEPFVVERPQLFSFVLLPVVVMTTRSALRGSNRALIGTFGITALWANLHGVFVVGVGVVGLLALGYALDRRTLLTPVMVAGGAAVAGFASPLLWRGYTNALYVPSVSVTINEWRSLDLGDSSDWLFLVVPALGILGMVVSRRWGSWEVLLPIIALTVATALAIRNAPLAAVIAAPEIAIGLSSLRVDRLRAWAAPRTVPIVVGVWIAGVVVAMQSTNGFGDLGRPEAGQFPVVAAEEIPAGCRLLNEYADGGYLIATRWPEVHVSQDGRNDLYGSERIERQRALLEGDSLVELEAFGIDCVLAETSRPLANALQASDRWSLLAMDQAGSLFVASP
ncbi:MAG: hypothetical protein OEM81_00295 [Acidimicrobiia bacterium]|nr:hypothetical protein [Acidimicrobiia bacterium]MDH3396250.1 hypothetical protein [Acidimicrobiia bacterium]